jgi:hypothetical protein
VGLGCLRQHDEADDCKQEQSEVVHGGLWVSGALLPRIGRAWQAMILRRHDEVWRRLGYSGNRITRDAGEGLDSAFFTFSFPHCPSMPTLSSCRQ